MFWAAWALGNAVLYGFITQANRYWQLPGAVLARWRALVPALFVLPLIFFVPAPGDPLFYLASIASGLMVLPHDGRVYDVAARYGSNVALRIRPLILPVVFGVWLVLQPSQFTALIQSPLLFTAITACLIGTTFFLMQMRHCAVSKKALREMLPILGAGVVFEICNKTAMDHAAFPGNMVYYMFIVSALPALIGFLPITENGKGALKNVSGTVRQGLTVGLIWVMMRAAKNLAMMSAPNPAYVTAVGLTAPFWSSLLMRLRGEKEEADWVSGTGMVLCIMVLAVLSGFVPHE
jgi:hypothetical protein